MANSDNISFRTMDLKPGSFGDLSISPYEKDLGSEDEPGVISKDGLEIRLGNRPTAWNLRKLYELGHSKAPHDFAVYDAYDIWLIHHRIGTVQREGSASLQALGYIADFGEIAQVQTISLLPETRFVNTSTGSLEVNMFLGAEGQACIPEEVKSVLKESEFLDGDVKLHLSSHAKLLARLSFTTVSPIITALGTGSSRCEWRFQKHNQPLLGDQTMLQTVLLPRHTKKVKFKIRAYALIKTNWISFPAKFETDWLPVEASVAL